MVTGSNHEFLGQTIDYNARRIDFQIEAVAEFLKGSSFRPIQRYGSGDDTENACLLNCCHAQKDQDFIQTDAPALLFLDLIRQQLLTRRERHDQRRKMVQLAADTALENWVNPFARILMTEIDLESDNWGKVQHGWNIDQSILLLHQDRQDLEFALAERLSRYCLEVLDPLFERGLSREISRQSVLDEEEYEKLIAWKPIDTPPSLIAELRPQRGFVARIGPRMWQYEAQHDQLLAVADQIFREIRVSQSC